MLKLKKKSYFGPLNYQFVMSLLRVCYEIDLSAAAEVGGNPLIKSYFPLYVSHRAGSYSLILVGKT